MTEQEILDQIQSEIANNRVFLYMKGTPEMPRCGFSKQVAQILNRSASTTGRATSSWTPASARCCPGWSDWPTIPQLFVDGQARRRLRHRHRDVPGRRAGRGARRRATVSCRGARGAQQPAQAPPLQIE